MEKKFTTKLYKLWINCRHTHAGEFCEDWKRYDVFETWAYANGYEPGARLKRVDASKPYGPDNCRFLLGKTEYNTPLYRVWAKMMYKSKYPVCAEWNQFPNFEVWALENGYEEDYTLNIIRANSFDAYTGETTYEWNPITTKFEKK